jgi:hypothetical protein
VNEEKKPLVISRHPDEPRVETGPVRFGGDWAGVFIRGDEALGNAVALRGIIYRHRSVLSVVDRSNLERILSLLESCDERELRGRVTRAALAIHAAELRAEREDES